MDQVQFMRNTYHRNTFNAGKFREGRVSYRATRRDIGDIQTIK